MPTRVNALPLFEKSVKQLRKKFPAIDDIVNELVNQIEADERPGDKIPNVGYDVYKVRLKNPDAQSGKSGGFRAIYYVRLENVVFMMTVYSKSQQSDVNIRELRQMIEDILASEDEFDEDD